MNTRFLFVALLLASSSLRRGSSVLSAPAKPAAKPAPKPAAKAKLPTPPTLILPVPGVGESQKNALPIRITPPEVKPTLFDPLQLLVRPEAMPAGKLAYVCGGSVPGNRFMQFYLVVREFGPSVIPGNAIKVYHVQAGTTDEIFGGNFSPDGRSYLVAAGWPWDAGGSMRYYLFNLETNKITPMPPDLYGSAFRWSPDSHFLAYTSGKELRVCDVRTGQSRLVARHPALTGNPTWTPLGMLLFTIERPKRAVSNEADAGKPGVIAKSPYTGEMQPDIYEVNIVGGQPQLLIENGNQPVPSPDGQWIAFFGLPDLPAEDAAKPEDAKEDSDSSTRPRLLLFNTAESKRYPLNANLYRKKITTRYLWSSNSLSLFVMEAWYHGLKDKGAEGIGWLKEVDITKRDVKEVATLKARDDAPTDRDSGNQFVLREASQKAVTVRASELGPREANSAIRAYINNWLQVDTKSGEATPLFKFGEVNGFDWHTANS